VKTFARNTQGESMVVDARNVTTIVWATSSAARSIVAVRRSANGTWSKRRVIGHGYAPQVAADARGNVTVVWLTQRPGFTDGVAAARRPASGPWSDPVRISRDLRVPGYPQGGEDVYGADDVDLAVSRRGAVAVAWAWGSDERDVPWRIQAVYRAPGGAWGQARNVTPASGADQPDVGIASDSTVVLLYARQLVGHPQELKARRRLAGTGWTGPTTVTPEGYTPYLAVDRAGNAVVVYSPDFESVDAVFRPADGRWRAPRALSPAGVEIQDYSLAMNVRGTALVGLVRGSGRVDLVERPPGGPWSAPARVEPAGLTVFDVVVALNGPGDTFVGFGGYALWGRYRPHGGDWGTRATLSPDSGVEVLEDTYAGVAPNGDVVVLWDQEARPLKARVMTAS
jgi:hypothetical protein